MASSEALGRHLDAMTAALDAGSDLPADTAATLAATTDILTLGALADEVRRARHGAATTFVRVQQMVLGDEGGWDAVASEATEVRIDGRPASLDAAIAAVSRARAVAGERTVRGFWLDDLAGFGPDGWRALAAAGLDGVAYAGATAAAASVRAARAAGLTVDVVAMDAPAADRLAWIAAARRLADAVGDIRGVAPLSRRLDRTTPTTGFDDVRTVALARLLLGPVPSVQIDWQLYGPKLAQVALGVGADDLDAVAPSDDPALGPRRAAAEEVRRNIAAAGLTALERDGRWIVRGS